MTPAAAAADDSKERACAAADMSDSNVSDYDVDYSYDDDDDDVKVQSNNADEALMMPEALVVGSRRILDESSAAATGGVSGGGSVQGLKRCERDDDDDHDDNDVDDASDSAERAAKSRRLDPSPSLTSSSVWVHPTAAADSAEKDAPPGDAIAGADHSDDSPSSPPPPASFQTEIKTQRPLGLLAQHRLQTTSSYRGTAERASTSSGSRGVDDCVTDEQQRLREVFGRRLTQAELEAAVAMQERLSGGGYCSVPSAAAAAAAAATCGGVGLMTSLPPTPSSAGVGLDFSATAASRGYDTLMDRRFIPSPPLSSASPCSVQEDSTSPLDATSSTPGHRHWTFQEQFKQVPDPGHSYSQS